MPDRQPPKISPRVRRVSEEPKEVKVMRVFALSLSLLSAAFVALAQTPAPPAAGEPAGVSVVKHSWSKERLGWERDPFGGPIGYADEIRIRARNEKRIDDAKRGGNSAEADRARRDAATDAAIIARARNKTAPRYAFHYKASVKNDGAKAIKSVDWDYVFNDAVSGDELGRLQFTSDAKIEPGKTRGLDVFTLAAPTKTVSAEALNSRERDGLREHVLLVRIVYTDGTVWQRQ
ncbi:MAG TPA: hypothetical protein VGV38_11960 [Pyrinomonadaceae bacterium]|nr:hypothetical protein [Pyrinomonadaceae bacterium]